MANYTLGEIQLELFTKLSDLFTMNNVFYFYPTFEQSTIYPRINYVIDSTTVYQQGNDNPQQKFISISVGYFDKTMGLEQMDKIIDLCRCLDTIQLMDFSMTNQVYDNKNLIYGIVYNFNFVIREG